LEPASKLFRFTQQILLLAAFLSGAATFFFGFFYFTLYWPYRDLFNVEGIYFDVQNVVVYHEQNVFLIVPSLAFLLLSLFFCITFRVRHRAPSSAASGP
jgi:hypothetical protein